MISKIFSKLKDPEYRKAFVASQINIAIPFQIRGLLKSRGWKQEDLAKRTGMLQPRISVLLTSGKARPNIGTLSRIAEAFDCGLEVRFVPFSELAYRSEIFDPENFSIPTFKEELRQAEEREEDALLQPNPHHRQSLSLDTTTNAAVAFLDVAFVDVALSAPSLSRKLSTVKEVDTSELGRMPPALKGEEYVAA